MMDDQIFSGGFEEVTPYFMNKDGCMEATTEMWWNWFSIYVLKKSDATKKKTIKFHKKFWKFICIKVGDFDLITYLNMYIVYTI